MAAHRDEGLLARAGWLIRLRWAAVGGIVTTVLVSVRGIGLPLRVAPLFGIAGVLGIANAGLLIGLRRARRRPAPERSAFAERLTLWQIILDLGCLAALLHFSGGVENPFLFFFVFHAVIAGILLPRRAGFACAAFSVFLMTALAASEYCGLLPHYGLPSFTGMDLHHNLLFVSGTLFVLASTLFIAAYLAAEVSERLRKSERGLRDANERLEEKDKVKSEYVLRVTHDVKEHLSAIQSCVDPVEEGILGPLNDKQKGLLKRATSRVQTLTTYIRSLLDLTRLRLGRGMETVEADLGKIAGEVAKAHGDNIRRKGLRFDFRAAPDLPRVTGMPFYLEAALSNLLANAVKYTPDGGDIRLELKPDGENVHVVLSDTGIGIPRDEQPRLFEEFFRASNARGSVKDGSGLGLAMVKQVVDRHGGRIWVESQEGRGSAFHILLPRARAADV
jgi:signal transduction histidine kinase